MATETNLGRVSFLLKGAWNSTATYNRLDVVSYQAQTYCARKTVAAGTLPTDTTNWMLLLDDQDALNEIKNQIGNLSSLTTTEKSNLVGAVNELDGDIGSLSSLTTTQKSSVVGAVNEHDAQLGTITSAAMGTTASTVSGAIKEHEDQIGDISTLTTTENSSLTGAINQLDGDIGNISGLTTTQKSSLVGAINEHDAQLGTITSVAMGTTASTVSGAIKEHEDQIGDLTTLTTDQNDNLVDSINEVKDYLTIKVSDKTSIINLCLTTPIATTRTFFINSTTSLTDWSGQHLTFATFVVKNYNNNVCFVQVNGFNGVSLKQITIATTNGVLYFSNHQKIDLSDRVPFTGDLNDVDSGYVRVNNALNQPIVGSGYVITIKRIDSYKSQIFISEQNRFFTRIQQGGTWKDWCQYVRTSIKNGEWLPSNGYDILGNMDVNTQCVYGINPDVIPSVGIPSSCTNYGTVLAWRNQHYNVMIYIDVYGNMKTYNMITGAWN